MAQTSRARFLWQAWVARRAFVSRATSSHVLADSKPLQVSPGCAPLGPCRVTPRDLASAGDHLNLPVASSARMQANLSVSLPASLSSATFLISSLLSHELPLHYFPPILLLHRASPLVTPPALCCMPLVVHRASQVFDPAARGPLFDNHVRRGPPLPQRAGEGHPRNTGGRGVLPGRQVRGFRGQGSHPPPSRATPCHLWLALMSFSPFHVCVAWTPWSAPYQACRFEERTWLVEEEGTAQDSLKRRTGHSCFEA